MACPFCEIAAGRAPAKVLHRSPEMLVIEPLEPVTSGHVLVIPTTHVEDFLDRPRISSMTAHMAARWTKQRQREDSRYQSVNVITSVGVPATQSVSHLHIHVVPRSDGDGLALPWTTQHP